MATTPTAVAFNTYFGDYLLGLWVTWTSTPTAGTGTSDIQFDWTCNLRGRLEVYGYGISIAVADEATQFAAHASDVAQNLIYLGGGVDGVGYTQANTIVPDKLSDWTYDDGTGSVPLYTDWKNASDQKLVPAITDIITTETGLDAILAKRYRIYLIWQNPDVQGTVTYDGFEAKIFSTLTPPAIGSWDTPAAMAAAPPTLTFKYADNLTSGSRFDIHPGNANSGGTDTEDMTLTAVGGSNDIDIVGDAATDLCTEKWYLSPTAIACVEMKGSLKRKRNTGDVLDDIILDYSSKYQVHAQIGRMDDSGEQLKFAAQEVDFNQFFSGAFEMSTSIALASTLVYAFAF